MDEFRRLDVELQMEVLKCEIYGMIAENQAAIALGRDPVYYGDSFRRVQMQFEELRLVLRT